MIKQIDRKVNDLQIQLVQFRRGTRVHQVLVIALWYTLRCRN